MKIKWTRNLIVTALLSFGMLQPASAQTEPYPSQPIKMVVPFAAGGYADVVARMVSDKLSKALGETVFVFNKPGAGSTIGTDMIAKAKPDGYTIGMISTTHVISPWVYKSIPYDALKDFEAITQVVDGPYVLVVNKDFPAKSVKELIAMAKAKPTVINYASSGNGSTQHLFAALFAQLAGIELTHVPYKGSGQALTDLLGGLIPMSFAGMPQTIQHIKEGRLRALAITGNERIKELPDVPTMEEAGVIGHKVTTWLGLVAPAGTPKNVIDKLRTATTEVLAAPDAIESIEKAGLKVHVSKTADDFHKMLLSEYDDWGAVAKKAGAKVN